VLFGEKKRDEKKVACRTGRFGEFKHKEDKGILMKRRRKRPTFSIYLRVARTGKESLERKRGGSQERHGVSTVFSLRGVMKREPCKSSNPNWGTRRKNSTSEGDY